MRIYYLDEPLSDADLRFVTQSLELTRVPEQVRIPCVLPPPPSAATHSDHMNLRSRHESLLRKNLRHAGIEQDRGNQIAFVAPLDMYWYSILMAAIVAETGHYPYLIQTETQRAARGNPGPIRVLDTEGLAGLKI